jgi:hypothetical protein
LIALEKVEQLIRGEEKRPKTGGEKPIDGGETKRRRRRGRTGRRREGILSNFPQTYLDSKGMGHVTSFLLFLRPRN